MNHPLRWLLAPLAMLYGFIVRLRYALYDRGWLPVRKLPVPVISVGNLQMGGTGKTPLVIHLVRYYQSRGKRVGVLTRGYGRREKKNVVVLKDGQLTPTADQVGDEPLLIYQHLQNGALGVGARRWEVATEMLRQITPDVIILDDGLQHRALHRDVDICLIDVTRWKHPGWLFPVSYFRDLPRVFRRVSAVILTKGEHHPERLAMVRQEVRRYTRAPLFTGTLQLVALRNLKTGVEVEWKRLAGQKFVVFSGIANPGHFLSTLQQEGLVIADYRIFSDHHTYTVEDVQSLVEVAREQQIPHLLTTEKDAVKLEAFRASLPDSVNLWVTVTEFHVEPEEPWRAFLEQVVPGA